MSRTKGSANRASKEPGEVKDVTIKVRVSKQFIEIMDQVGKETLIFRGLDRSKIMRKAAMSYLLNICHPKHIDIIQQQLFVLV